MSARSIAFTVTGRVQGVGFRDFTQRSATKLGVSGSRWLIVMDLTGVGVANGSHDVQGEALGDSAAIDAFVRDLHRGPSLASVTDVTLTRDEPAETTRDGTFDVRRSVA